MCEKSGATSEPTMMRLRLWECGLLLSVVTILTMLVFVTSPNVFDSVDFLRFHSLLHDYSTTALRAGRLPLWNPHINLGRPFLADLQTGVFYPANLVYLFLPTHIGFITLAVTHLSLLVAGTALLASYLGARRVTAWAAGLTFAFAGITTSTLQTGSIECIEAQAYLPWVFLLGARLQDRTTWNTFVGLVVVLALQGLCGHPQISWLTVVGLVVFIVTRRAHAPFVANARLLARDLALLFSCGVAAFAVDAAQLLPFYDLVRQGNRAAPSLAAADAWAMRSMDWAAWFRPTKPTFIVNWTYNAYIGMLAVLAGVVGLSRWKDRNIRGLFLMSGLAVLLALGTRTPAFAALYHLLPGVALFRLHGRAELLIAMALCLTSALVIQRALNRREIFGMAVLAAFAVLVNLATEYSIAVKNRSWLEVSVRLSIIVLAVAGLWVWPKSATLSRSRSMALVALLVLDLAFATLLMKRTYVFPHEFPAEPLVKAVLTNHGLLSPGQPPPRISMPYPYVRENAGLIHGWSTFNGYVSLSLDRVWVYLHRSLGLEPSLTNNTIPANTIYRAGSFPFASMNLVLGWNPRTRGGEIAGNPDPRVYLAREVSLEPSWHKAIDRMREGHDFHRRPLVESPIELASVLPDNAHSAPCTARIIAFAPERVEVATSCPGPGVLVLAEAYALGWGALVDGVLRPVVPANAWMRAVAVPMGEHTVVFVYRESKLATGIAISLTSILGLFVSSLIIAGRVKRKHRACDATSSTADDGPTRGRCTGKTTQPG